jgi:hypothetical protein
MAFERNQTILELFIRTIQREYNHLVRQKELVPYREDIEQLPSDKLIKIIKGQQLSIIKVLMEFNDMRSKL